MSSQAHEQNMRDMDELKSYENISKEITEKANAHAISEAMEKYPAIESLLYDLNLMPEQV